MLTLHYIPFLNWANANRSASKLAGDAAARFERTDDFQVRWSAIRVIGASLASDLDSILADQSTGDAELVEKLEQEIFAAVNAPIETAAPVERETRDKKWLLRLYAAACWLCGALDGDELLTGPPKTDADGPVPSTDS